MRLTLYSSRTHDVESFARANRAHGFDLAHLRCALNPDSAGLAQASAAVCGFVHDDLGRAVLTRLRECGVRFVLLRCAGFERLDQQAAHEMHIGVARVAAYSPASVAEHAVMLIQALNRHLSLALHRTENWNFVLSGLTGFELASATVGVVGAGQIGARVARILGGYGASVLVADPVRSEELERAGARYVELPELLAHSDAVTLHAPLCAQTRHLIDQASLRLIKRGALLVNTARGGLIDNQAVLKALDSGVLGGYAMDVYESESGVFFTDRSQNPPDDPILAALRGRDNVLITPHQGFLTNRALDNIAGTTLASLADFAAGRTLGDPDNLLVSPG